MSTTFYQNYFSLTFFLSLIIHCGLVFFLLVVVGFSFINTKALKPFTAAQVILVPAKSSSFEVEVNNKKATIKLPKDKPADKKKAVLEKPAAKVDKPKSEFSLSAKKSSDLISDLTLSSVSKHSNSQSDDVLSVEDTLFKDDFEYLYTDDALISPTNKTSKKTNEQVNLSNQVVETSFDDALAAYQSQLINLVKKNWRPPKDYNKKSFPTVVAYLKSNGDILKVDLKVSSKNTFLDKSALDAVNFSQPFPPFPKELAADKIFVVPFNFKDENFLN